MVASGGETWRTVCCAERRIVENDDTAFSDASAANCPVCLRDFVVVVTIDINGVPCLLTNANSSNIIARVSPKQFRFLEIKSVKVQLGVMQIVQVVTVGTYRVARRRKW